MFRGFFFSKSFEARAVSADSARRLASWIRPSIFASSRSAMPLDCLGKVRPARTLMNLTLPKTRGMDKVAKVQPRWRDYFTLYGDGAIDINTAPADLIEAFFGCTPDAAVGLVATRNGEDLVENTEDDYRFQSTDEARVLLGMSCALEVPSEVIPPAPFFFLGVPPNYAAGACAPVSRPCCRRPPRRRLHGRAPRPLRGR